MHADLANLCRQSVTYIAFNPGLQWYQRIGRDQWNNGCAYREVHDAPLRGWLLLDYLGSASSLCIVHHLRQTCRILTAY